jgi:DNA-nicking Smr family endonuclease
MPPLVRTDVSKQRKLPPPPEPELDDAALFRQAIGPVRALPVQDDPARSSRPQPEPEPRLSQADERQVLAELLSDDMALIGLSSGEVLAHLQDGYPPKLLRQLRRGQFVVEAELDLHHLRVPEARALLSRFLAECRRDRHRCVRIVHGKARNSESGSVIKAMTDRVLRQRADVIGYTSARPQDGGTGAVIALLHPPK